VGWDSLAGIAICYGSDGPDRIPGENEIFCTCPGAHRVSFLGMKWLGRGVDHPPPSRAEVKKEESYTSTPSEPSSPVVGRT